jgi:hypothetical protein
MGSTVHHQFQLTFANTGIEDINHIQATEDYFVALKLRTGGIVIKNVGGIPVESGVCASLKSKQSCPLLINFCSQIEVVNEVVKNNGVPSMRGVRLTITFRRKADGRDYRIIKGYGTIGPHAEGMFPPGIPQDRFPDGNESRFPVHVRGSSLS